MGRPARRLENLMTTEKNDFKFCKHNLIELPIRMTRNKLQRLRYQFNEDDQVLVGDKKYHLTPLNLNIRFQNYFI